MPFVNVYEKHDGDVTMGAIASQITSLTIVCSTVYSDADQRKHQSSASLAFVRKIHRLPVNSPHKWPVTRKMFPCDDVIMFSISLLIQQWNETRSFLCFRQETILDGRPTLWGRLLALWHVGTSLLATLRPARETYQRFAYQSLE